MNTNNADNDMLYSKTRYVVEPVRRAIDVLVSAIGIVVISPIIILFGFLVFLETPGPIFYSQERLGKNGKTFNLYKIRSMFCDAEKNGARWASIGDDRITKVGKFIRKTRIDELPQLFNILIGDMSIVGPRPEREMFYVEFEKRIPGFSNRLCVKPGLTGWAQVNGGYDITPEEKLKYDLFYINNKSIILDILIIIKTFKVVLTGEGAR